MCSVCAISSRDPTTHACSHQLLVPIGGSNVTRLMAPRRALVHVVLFEVSFLSATHPCSGRPSATLRLAVARRALRRPRRALRRSVARRAVRCPRRASRRSGDRRALRRSVARSPHLAALSDIACAAIAAAGAAAIASARPPPSMRRWRESCTVDAASLRRLPVPTSSWWQAVDINSQYRTGPAQGTTSPPLTRLSALKRGVQF